MRNLLQQDENISLANPNSKAYILLTQNV